MKKIILLMLLLLPISNADLLRSENYQIDYVIKPGTTQSTITFVANPILTREYKGYIYTPISLAIIIGGGGGGGTSISTDRYELIVQVKKDTYRVGSNVEAEIFVINKKNSNDRDVEIRTYLFSPLNQTYDEQLQVIENLPPACSFGEFNLSLRACTYNELMYETEAVIIEHRLKLPDNSEEGIWQFVVELDTRFQPKVFVYDEFEVKKIDYLIPGLVLALIFLLRKRKLEIEAKRKLMRNKDD